MHVGVAVLLLFCPGAGGTLNYTFSEFREGPQDPKLFEIPSYCACNETQAV